MTAAFENVDWDATRQIQIETMQEQLGFCNCGNPDSTQVYIMKALRWWRDSKEDLASSDEFPLGPQRKAAWDAAWERTKQANKELFKTDQAFWFFAYWADAKGYTEHSGNVGWSSFLSYEGEALLEKLEALHGDAA